MKSEAFRFPGKLTDGFVLLAATMFVLWTGPAGYQNMQASKFDLFCLLFGGYLALMLLFSVELMAIRRIRPPTPVALWKKASPVQRCVVLFWTASALSTLCSPYGSTALLGMTRGEGLLTVTLYCGTFLCVSAFARPRAWWGELLGAVMTVFSGICLLQMQGFNPLWLYPEGYTYFDANVKYGGIYLGTVGNADLAAALLCLAIPVFWVMLLRLKETRRWWLLLPLLLSLAALLQMNVQAGLLAVAVGTALTIPAVAPVSRRTAHGLWLVLAAAAVLALVLIWNCDRTWGIFYELREILHGNWDPEFGSGRLYIWQEVLQRVPSHLLLGTGPDTMAAAQIPGYVRINSVTGEPMEFLVDVAHNEYLNLLYHQGLLALLPYLGALGVSAYRWLKQSRKNPAAAILGAAVLCYGIQAFFGFSMCQTAGLFWIVWGLLERVCNEKEEECDE